MASVVPPSRAPRSKLSGTLAVVNQASDTVTLIDLATMEANKHVQVVGGPHEVAVSPDGGRAIVTNYRKHGEGPQKALSLISLPDGAVLKTIDLSEYRAPHDVHWVNDRQVVCTTEDNQALLLVDVESGKIQRVNETGKDGSHMLALSPDGRWVWAGNRAEDTVSIIDVQSLELVKTLETPGFPYRVEFTPNGRYALVPHAVSGTLMLGDVADQQVIKHIPLGLTGVDEPSTAGVFPHPDNVHALVTVRNDNSVLVLNLETGETLARVEVQSSPDGVAWSPVQR
ncbi:MAG: cytochrome D1 domain-containing protein [Xanthomonadales bacterium]|nr:cytochrome D1 domain-containing protein [Xanthomonadales bacterium]